MMIRKQKLASSKLRVTILGAAMVVAAFGVGGSKGYAQVEVQSPLQANLDVNGLITQIEQSVAGAQNRGGAVKQMRDYAYINYGHQRYNVMVFNTNQNYDASKLNVSYPPGLVDAKGFPQGVLTVHYNGIPFNIWFIDSGTFVNQGDGGFDNWAFDGNWSRTGQDNKTVVFTRRTNAPPAPLPLQPNSSQASPPQASSSQASSSQSGTGIQGGLAVSGQVNLGGRGHSGRNSHGKSAAPKTSKPQSGTRPQNGSARARQAHQPRSGRSGKLAAAPRTTSRQLATATQHQAARAGQAHAPRSLSHTHTAASRAASPRPGTVPRDELVRPGQVHTPRTSLHRTPAPTPNQPLRQSGTSSQNPPGRVEQH
jgi:hypothetical protein